MNFRIFFIIFFTKAVISCDPEEISVINLKLRVPIYFVHTILEASKGSLQVEMLHRMCKYSVKDLELPLVFNGFQFRPAERRSENFSTFAFCGKPKSYDVEFFSPPFKYSGHGILYGCNIRTGVDVIILVYDDEPWNAVNDLLEMPKSIGSKICDCNKTATEYVNECLRSSDRIPFVNIVIICCIVVFAGLAVVCLILNNK